MTATNRKELLSNLNKLNEEFQKYGAALRGALVKSNKLNEEMHPAEQVQERNIFAPHP